MCKNNSETCDRNTLEAKNKLKNLRENGNETDLTRQTIEKYTYT